MINQINLYKNVNKQDKYQINKVINYNKLIKKLFYDDL